MKKILLLAMVGLLVCTNVYAESRWERELKENGTWSIEKTTPSNQIGDKQALDRILNPPITPPVLNYAGNGSSITETIPTPTQPIIIIRYYYGSNLRGIYGSRYYLPHGYFGHGGRSGHSGHRSGRR